MAKQTIKPGSAEDAHFRIDELERKVASLGSAPANPLAHAAAAIGIGEGLRSAFDSLKVAVERDAAKDTQVGERLEQLSRLIEELLTTLRDSHASHARLTEALESHGRALTEHSEQLRSPRTKVGRVMLPTGPVEMTITDSASPPKH